MIKFVLFMILFILSFPLLGFINLFLLLVWIIFLALFGASGVGPQYIIEWLEP